MLRVAGAELIAFSITHCVLCVVQLVRLFPISYLYPLGIAQSAQQRFNYTPPSDHFPHDTTLYSKLTALIQSAEDDT